KGGSKPSAADIYPIRPVGSPSQGVPPVKDSGCPQNRTSKRQIDERSNRNFGGETGILEKENSEVLDDAMGHSDAWFAWTVVLGKLAV
ncbi:MAG: hypothetical protein RMK45_09450, partial [Armatimonadota bacterium]|nr:hypothetical protein [Armatimonadota bacterium]